MNRSASNCKKSAFTLMELMVVLGATVALLAAAVSFYSFVITRTAADLTRAAVVMQANSLADEITRNITNAVDCDTSEISGTDDIQIALPRQGTDRDADGNYDKFVIDSADSSGVEEIKKGDRVWYFMSDDHGDPDNSGTYLWRARMKDGEEPKKDDADLVWSKRGGQRRWNLIDSIVFSNDSTNKCTTFTITASSLNRSERTASTSTDRMSYSITITRTIFWRNAR